MKQKLSYKKTKFCFEKKFFLKLSLNHFVWYRGKSNKLCSSKCRLDIYFQPCRINFNSSFLTVISSRFFVCWKVVQLYNFSAHEKPTGNNCAGIKVTILLLILHSSVGNNCPICIWSCTVDLIYPRTDWWACLCFLEKCQSVSNA